MVTCFGLAYFMKKYRESTLLLFSEYSWNVSEKSIFFAIVLGIKV